ncbi:MAG: glycoside hydrolase family 3 C-terminal domain-containing protein [Isosphaeraceae bacterium]|nr:glycoside hydrolase family 3 C-terminal domain-containing protein [Isosphaeraceae bacterium]
MMSHMISILILALVIPALPAVAQPSPHTDVEARIDALLQRMTLEEKLGQLQQLGGDPNTGDLLDGQRDLVRRGQVGSLLNVRGARNTNEVQRLAVEQSSAKVPILFAFDAIHGYRTIFPIPLGEASSWDPATAERSMRITAAEAAAAGVRWVLAPMVDIARDPRWGRIAEGAGEDPYLGSVMARARVRGLQGDDYGAPDRVVACVKHWVAYGAAEGGREYNAADISERTLRAIYFPPFRAALDAGAGTVMTALNTINGIPATAHPFTIGEVLRREWRFDGLVVSDYDAVKQLIPHGLAADESEAALLALLAGIDMEEQSRLFQDRGPQLVRDGRLPLARIDEAVRRVLRLKFRLGLFEHPYADEDRERAVLLSREHLAAAREAAGRALVLLKNEDGALPLRKDLRAIAVLGPLADDREAPLGHWRSDGKTEDVVSLLAGIRAKVAEQAGSTRVVYAKGCEVEGDDAGGIAEAVQLARESDVAIVAVGESAAMSGEAASRTSLDLSGRQLDLIRAVHATGTPTVVVLINGRPLTIGWVAEHIPAILEAWFGGTQGGLAIADALFGDLNPGGKLPVTFPRAVGQAPLYYNHLNTGRPATDDRYTSKYIDAPVSPLYPFGYGLSYTRFRLSDLRLSARGIPPDGRLEVSVAVENVGDRIGDEVVQLYIRDVAASVVRPIKELRGFERVTLRPGETQIVRFTLTPEALGFYDRRMRFVVEPGEFRVIVGTSSEGGLEAGFQVIE